MKFKIKSISVKNIRSIKSSGKIEIKPINILVGRNSSGKSTFARLFPLLKQTALSDKKHAVLWYGQTVDFGSFETTAHLNDPNAQIEICIESEINEDNHSNIYEIKVIQANDEIFGEVTPYVSVKSKNFTFEIISNEYDSIEKYIVNGIEFFAHQDDFSFLTFHSLIPTPSDSEDILNSYIKQKYNNNCSESDWDLIRNLEIYANGRPINEPAKNAVDFINRMFSNKSGKLSDLKKFADEEFFNVANAQKIITTLNKYFSEYFSNLVYVEPVRATAQRYKREQQLDANSIDPSGNNIYEFLYGKQHHLYNFNKWLYENFNFVIKIESNNDHISIKVKEPNSRIYTNITDAGFGYSQSLPILAQIWLGTHASKWGKMLNTMVIEQPELHLHPAFQAQLADIFVQFSNTKDKNNLNLIVETHSEHIIKRLGTLIAEEKIPSKDIQILVFEKFKNGSTKIRKSHFNKDGILTNWPIGFFIP